MKKRNELNLHGLLIINKPINMTSHKVVNYLRKALNVSSVGHTGTLDPIATGVLPIVIGNATKLSESLMATIKEYKVSLVLGIQTDTYDITGNIVNSKDIQDIDYNMVKDVILSFIGKQEQKPPIYSAIKIDGKPAYKYARNNVQINLTKREIEIYNIDNIKFIKETNQVEFVVSCSKGTYIRSLCNDIGISLNNYATMTSLTRTRTGDFSINNAIDLNEYINLPIEKMYDKVIKLDDLYSSFPEIKLDNESFAKYINGQSLPININTSKDTLIRVYINNGFKGIGKYIKGNLKRFIVV